MSTWGTVTWDIARAGGFTAYALLTISVALGLALTMQWQSARWPRLINSELHNFVTLLALVFTVVHVMAIWLDPFTRFGWSEVFIPLVSHYRPLWMALGIVALYLGLAIGASTLLRPLIGYRWWRRLHVLTLGVFALVTVHGLATGSDTRTWWGMGIYLASVLVVGTLLCVRLLVPATPRGRAHPVLAAGGAVLLLAGAVWVAAGPLLPGWNTVANNGNGSGARIALAAGASTAATGSGTPSTTGGGAPAASNPLGAAFADSAQGTLTQQGPDGAGNVTLQVRLSLSGSVPATLVIVLQGQAQGDGSIAVTDSSITLTPSQGGTTYAGPLTTLRAESAWRMGAVLTNRANGTQAIQLRADLRVDNSGAVNGSVTGAPATSAAAPSDTGGENGTDN